MNKGPTFGDMLSSLRASSGITVRELSQKGHIPYGTIATLIHRKSAHARTPVVKALAQGFDLPLLGIAAVAGYFEREKVGEAEPSIEAVMVAMKSGVLPRFQEDKAVRFSHQGIMYVKEVLGVTAAFEIMRWSEKWGLSATEKDIGIMLHEGTIPEGWRADPTMQWMDQLPGSWFWSWFYEIGPLKDSTYSFCQSLIDTIGLMFLMGRIGPEAAQAWQCQDDYSALWDAYQNTMSKWSLVGSYRQAIHHIEWTTDPHNSREESVVTEVVSTESKELGPSFLDLSKKWQNLTPSQRQIVMALVDHFIESNPKN